MSRSEEKSLKAYLVDSSYAKRVRARAAWRELIDVEIPELMCLDGLLNGQHNVIPACLAIAYWYKTFKDGFSLEWLEMIELEFQFRQAWAQKHHPALGLRFMEYDGRTQLCIYVKPTRGKEPGGEEES